MNISNLLKDETIFMSLDAANQSACLNSLADSMEKAGFLTDKQLYLNAVMEREKKGSTGVGFGVAIPHGKSSGVTSAGLAFAHLKNPIEWNSLDGGPVSIVFMIAVPEQDASNEHIKILIALSRKLIHEEFRNQLLDAKTSEDIFKILQSL